MGKKGKEPKAKKEKAKPEKKSLINAELLKGLDLKDVFQFENGDVYMGQFNITPEGDIFRQGRGKYFTADGNSLVGHWERDVLVEAERLSSVDATWYKGLLEAGKYEGPGFYGHPRVGTLECDFLQGRPAGRVVLTDRDGRTWEGHASSGSLTMLPRNHFFDPEEALLHPKSVEDLPKKSRISTEIAEIENN